MGSGWASYSDLPAAPLQAINALIEANWELHAETMAQYYFGWSEPEQAKKWVAQFRQAATPEATRARQRTLPSWDAPASRALIGLTRRGGRSHSLDAGARSNLVQRWQPLQPVPAEGQVKGGGDTLLYWKFLLAP